MASGRRFPRAEGSFLCFYLQGEKKRTVARFLSLSRMNKKKRQRDGSGQREKVGLMAKYEWERIGFGAIWEF